MDRGGTFACPECGNELALKGNSAGRQIRCGWCETWVEIPFLPRAVVRRARFSRGRRPRWVVWAWGGIAILTVLTVMFGANRVIRDRSRHRIEQRLAGLMARAEAAESEGRFGEAVAAIQEAVRAGSQLRDGQSERLQARDRLVRRAAEAEIESAARAEPAVAVAVYKGLLSRAWRDGALEGLEETLRDRLERTRRQWAETDLAAAKQAVAAGQANEALTICERLMGTTESLDSPAQEPLQAETNAIVADLIEQRGVVFKPPTGEFTLGSPASYQATLERLFEPVLRQHGYVPRRAGSRWSELWDTRGPYHVSAQVVERQLGSYLNSGNRLSSLSFDVGLNRGEATVWRSGPLLARTQPSIPSLSAFTSSRLMMDKNRRIEAERLLYDDARSQLDERLNANLRKLPDLRLVTFGPSGTASP